MDISGLTGIGTQTFTGYGGTQSLPSSVQAKILTQTQDLSLLPPVSATGIGANLDIYSAVNMQAMGALSGLSSLELAQAQLASQSPSADAAPTPSATPASTDPPVGAMLDQLLKEDGFEPQTNPYEVRTDFFADRGSLGGLVDYLG